MCKTMRQLAILFSVVASFNSLTLGQQPNKGPEGQRPNKGPDLYTDSVAFNEQALSGLFQYLLTPKYAEDFDLLDEQIEKLKELDAKRNSIMILQLANSTAESGSKGRQEKQEEIREQLTDITKKTLKVLLPFQLDRLRQIVNQQRVRASGTSAGITAPATSKELGIKADQQERIQSLVEASEKEINEKTEAYQKEIEEIRKRSREAVLDLLTEDQKKKYKELFGSIIEEDTKVSTLR